MAGSSKLPRPHQGQSLKVCLSHLAEFLGLSGLINQIRKEWRGNEKQIHTMVQTIKTIYTKKKQKNRICMLVWNRQACLLEFI